MAGSADDFSDLEGNSESHVTSRATSSTPCEKDVDLIATISVRS
jgi:hypothetical protein